MTGDSATARIKVADLSDLGDARPVVHYVELAGREVILVAPDDGQIYCIDAICTHGFGYLDQGELQGCEIQCPLHEGRFDVRTGEPTNPPAVEPVRSYPVDIDNGEVFISW